MNAKKTDLLGNPLSYTEQAVLDIRTGLEDLLARDDLPPCVVSNALHAMAAVSQIITDLDLDYRP